MRRKRQVNDLSEGYWKTFTNVGHICLVGYIIYLLPFFLFERTLFLHHYLPALVFKLIILAAVFEYFSFWIPERFVFPAIFLILIIFLYYFLKLLPLSYGSGNLTSEGILELKLKDTWQLIIHKS